MHTALTDAAASFRGVQPVAPFRTMEMPNQTQKDKQQTPGRNQNQQGQQTQNRDRDNQPGQQKQQGTQKKPQNDRDDD